MNTPAATQQTTQSANTYPKQITKTIIFEVSDKDDEDYLNGITPGFKEDITSFGSDINIQVISTS